MTAVLIPYYNSLKLLYTQTIQSHCGCNTDIKILIHSVTISPMLFDKNKNIAFLVC